MTAGNFLLKLATVLAVVSFVGALRWARGHESSKRLFTWAYHGMTASLLAASALLMAAILMHDFRFEYVYSYSSRDLPLLYLISAFWAGQSGTYLLWALFGALIGYALFRKRSWEPAAAMVFYIPTIGFMLGLMLVPDGNPFKLMQGLAPDGRGLNPLLQDPWMASHPPTVFLGYAAMTVPAVLALVALWKRQNQAWLGPAMRWALFGFVSLGAGIVLGGFWAYKVLGWGGYWGWDPVENASLIPWLVVTALIHGLLVFRATGALRLTNLILAVAGYVLVLYATFLTRSGVLADFSVHSFPSGSIYRVLETILLLSVLVPIVLFIRARLPFGKDIPFAFSWPFVLTVILVMFSVSAGFVLIGTSWPIISSFLGKASSLGTSWYNTVSLPLYVVLLAVLGLAPFLGWAPRPLSMLAPRLIVSLAAASLGTALAVLLGGHGIGALMLFFVALFALASNVTRFVEVVRARWLNTGAAIAHIGFALMFVGIVGSSVWGVGQEARLPLGQPVEVLGRTMTFEGHVDGSEPQDRWRVRVEEPNGSVFPAEVSMFRMSGGQENSYFSRPAIRRGIAGDLYIAPQGLQTTGGSRQLELGPDEPLRLGGATISFEKFETSGMEQQGHDMTVLARLRVDVDGQSQEFSLPFTATARGFEGAAEDVPLMPGLTLALQRMNVEAGRLQVLAEDSRAPRTQILNVEASTKPLVGILWIGTLLLGIGCLVAVTRRALEARVAARSGAPLMVGAPPARGGATQPEIARLG